MSSAEDRARDMIKKHNAQLEKISKMHVDTSSKPSVSAANAKAAAHSLSKLAKVVREEGAAEARKIRAAASEVRFIAAEKKKAEPKKKRGPTKGVKRGPRKAKVDDDDPFNATLKTPVKVKGSKSADSKFSDI